MILSLDEITVGARVRRDLGDLTSLCESMSEVGLLNPITVDNNYRLIAGARRLEAARRLGWQQVDARVVDSLADAVLALKAERDENTCRVDFTPAEAVAMGLRLEELLAPLARERMIAAHASPGNLPEQRGQVRDQVGAAVGMSGRTYEKAKSVVAAGVEPLVEAMDSGEVSISAAAEVAKLPRPVQEQLVQAGPEAVKAVVAELRSGAVVQDMADVEQIRARRREQAALPKRRAEMTEEEQRDLDDYARLKLFLPLVDCAGMVSNPQQREITARVLFDRATFERHVRHPHHHEEVLKSLHDLATGLVALFEGRESN